MKLPKSILILARFAFVAIVGAWGGMLLWWSICPLDSWVWQRISAGQYEIFQLLAMGAGALLGGWLWGVLCRNADKADAE